MAVDTRAKRFSLLGLGMDALRARPFGADATVSTQDRLFFLPIYVGIALIESLPFPAHTGGKMTRRRGRGRGTDGS